jgi:MOSC domain-containing protein YiiM
MNRPSAATFSSAATMIRIEHIYLSPGHAYFGQHGQGPADHPMIAVPEVECVAGRGLRGDRFFDYKADYKGQVTFFAGEIYDELRDSLDAHEREPWAFRRNVITRGVDLNSLIGVEFTIQNIRFHGSAECSPCEWMDVGFAPGARAALVGRGGLRARILSDGILRVDAPSPA